VRRMLAMFMLFGAIPFTTGAFVVSRLWLEQPALCIAAVVLWWAAASAAVWWAGEFRCPRCRRRFGALGSHKGVQVVWRGLFDKVCSNCKLRRGESAQNHEPERHTGLLKA
jgi:Leu/Phe-tRNA-protein transferase